MYAAQSNPPWDSRAAVTAGRTTKSKERAKRAKRQIQRRRRRRGNAHSRAEIRKSEMAKRSSQGTDGAAAFRKRQKLTQEVPVGEDVTSSEHLRGLLTFDQDMRNARHGLFLFLPTRFDGAAVTHH